jgi:hypothetical protein
MRNNRQYDVFILAKDINPEISKGMTGVLLEIWGRDSFEVEFVKEDGSNYMYEEQGTFTVDESFIGEIKWSERPGISLT